MNIIEFGRSNYSLIQNSCYFIHYFTRYGHFKFDIKRFCAFYINILCDNGVYVKLLCLLVQL